AEAVLFGGDVGGAAFGVAVKDHMPVEGSGSSIFNDECPVAGRRCIVEINCASPGLIVERRVASGREPIKANVPGSVRAVRQRSAVLVVESGVAGSGGIVKLGRAAEL